MKFKTSITDVQKNGTETIRGKALTDLIEKNTFVQTIFLILQGELPTESEEKMLNAIFTAIIDHGPGTTSALMARISASANNPMHCALAAGILGFGERHGVALEATMKFFYKNLEVTDIVSLLTSMKEQKKYAPGFGHKGFEERDPRSDALLKKAKELGFFGKHCEFALRVHKELNALSSKKLPLNVDGSIGAILCDMGFDSRLGRGIFVIGRIPGLVAQVYEEMMNDTGIRRVDVEDIEYIS